MDVLKGLSVSGVCLRAGPLNTFTKKASNINRCLKSDVSQLLCHNLNQLTSSLSMNTPRHGLHVASESYRGELQHRRYYIGGLILGYFSVSLDILSCDICAFLFSVLFILVPQKMWRISFDFCISMHLQTCTHILISLFFDGLLTLSKCQSIWVQIGTMFGDLRVCMFKTREPVPWALLTCPWLGTESLIFGFLEHSSSWHLFLGKFDVPWMARVALNTWGMN